LSIENDGPRMSEKEELQVGKPGWKGLKQFPLKLYPHGRGPGVAGSKGGWLVTTMKG
jgi:hypothetical protein